MRSTEEWLKEFGEKCMIPPDEVFAADLRHFIRKIQVDGIREGANVSVSVAAFEGASAEQILGTVTTAFRMAIIERAREVESQNG